MHDVGYGATAPFLVQIQLEERHFRPKNSQFSLGRPT